MLMFVFGAGASFDSDPYRIWSDDYDEAMYPLHLRPPLATGLFEPRSDEAREAASAFERATPLMMRLREAARSGEDIEEVLESIQERAESYSGTKSQLLALRAYLARLMSALPAGWHEDCAGQTNYVLALDQAARWREEHDPDSPVVCVTFNYDTLLERAHSRVHGTWFDAMDDYIAQKAARIYKPHGSVDWRQRARWDVEAGNFAPTDQDALLWAIDSANDLRWEAEIVVADPENPRYQDPSDAATLWLPALAIPARRKATFTMPQMHLDALSADLSQVTKVVTIGWRAREQHFLEMLTTFMPPQAADVVAVAESEQAARATVDTLWSTGRFGRYALATDGFSGFTKSRRSHEHPASPILAEVLDGQSADFWTRRG